MERGEKVYYITPEGRLSKGIYLSKHNDDQHYILDDNDSKILITISD